MCNDVASLASCVPERLLLAISIDPIVARLSGHYLKIACLALPGNYCYLLLTKFLQVQVRLLS